MSRGSEASDPVGEDKMNALCQELLLPGPAIMGSEDNHGISSENLAMGQSLLLTEASVVGTETAGVEIFVEAIGDTMSISNPGNTTEVLVKVVELYFCERCGQSFSDPGLLAQHPCPEPPRGHLASIPQLQGLPLGLTSQDLSVSGEQSSVVQAPAQDVPDGSGQDPELGSEPFLCPVCQVAFALPGALKEHFKDHQKAPGTPEECPEEGCTFSSGARKQLREHVRQVHGASPVACAYRGCLALFRTREDMELHRRTHFPFHCGRCSFVSANAKQFGQHRRSHLQAATQQEMVEGRGGAQSIGCSFPPGGGKELTDHLLLNSGRAEVLSQAGNGLKGQSDWEITETGPALEAPSASHYVPSEDVGVLAKKSDAGNGVDQLLNAEEEVEGEESYSKDASSKILKGDVAGDSRCLYKTHMCPECKRCFKKRTHLMEHLHLHFPDPRLQCPNCQKFFTSKSKLKIHMMRETGEKAHRCLLCHYSSVEKNALNRHMASMHEGISNFYSDVYSCPVCQEAFKLSQALKEHLKSHKAEPKQLSCFQAGCGYRAEDRKEFVRHVKEAHGARAVECKYYACSLLFPTAEAMEAHRKTHYAFHCQQCDFICSNKHVFRKHKKQGHPGSEQLRCGFCSFATFNAVEFHDHVGKMHASEKIHKCAECNFATAHKRVLIRHMLLHTGEKPHKCQLCNFTCRDVSYLSKHMLTHSEDKNYMCTECGYVTKWKHYLNVHMRKHTGDLRYQCNQCPYRCHRADQLSSHKLRHQGKSLICEVCGFACKRKYELQKHVQAKHSQDYQMPLFQCQYCSYQTKYKQALFNHENCKHTKQREFRCALCAYRTFSNTSLFFHKRKAHGYVPGDKGWQENYASRELEASSSGVLLSYNLAVSVHSEPSCSSLPGREPWQEEAKPLAAEAQEEEEEEEDGHREPLAPPLFGNGSAAQKREEGTVGGQEQHLVLGTPSEELSLKVASVGMEEPGGGSEPVPTCTLHLEPLCDSGPVLEPLTEEMPTALAETGDGALSCRETDSAHEALGSRDPLVLESGQPALEDAPDFEEEAEVPGDGDVELEKDLSPSAGEGDAKHGLQDLRGTEVNRQSPAGLQEPPSPERAAGGQEAPDALPNVVEQASLQPSPDRKASVAPEGTLLPSSSDEGSPPESVLRALRKQDKEQAETLVLEGRVQMLVVQSKSRVFKCEKCSYLTRKEKCLLVHCRAGCQSKKGPLACQQCGATFKQQRGLDTHLRKKCPALAKRSPRKTACLDPPAAAEPSDTSPGAAELEKNGRGALEEAGASPLKETLWGVGWRAGHAESVPTLLPGSQSGATAVHDQPPPVVPETLMEERLLTVEGEPAGGHVERYRLEQGKFHCRSCSFACSRVSTIRSHVEDACRASEQFCCPLCSRTFRSKRALKAHQADGHAQPQGARLPNGPPADVSPAEEKERENGRTSPGRADRPDEGGAGPEAAPPPLAPLLRKRRPFACPACPFTCHQERALKTHRQRGCLKLGEFRCPLCPFTAKAAAALRLHRKLHRRYYGAGRPPLACRQCDFTCKQAHCLRQHVRLKHEGVKPHKCPFCDFCTTRRYRLEAHQSLHTGVGRVACPACGQTFGTNSKLRVHRLRVHEKRPTHFCSLCDYSGYIQNDITRHVNSCHRGELTFACGRCEARFSSETALKQHALRQHEEKASYGCPRCAFVCRSEATLKCHTQRQHPHLECTTCKETLASREELEEHKKLHFGHRCELCGFAARERPQLVSHYVEAHEPSSLAEERPLRCSFCDFGCRHQLVLDHHMKGHGGTRVYKCADCDYTTKNKQKITWHIRIHTGEKPYKCHQCQYACADPSRLKYHMRIHKEERKYLCPECGYKCKWVNQLKYHMTKHTGLKPYQCDECNYCTNRADALRIHKETRHREARSFICEQCGKAFKTRFLLKTHLKKHSEEKPYVCNVCYRGFRWAAGLRHHYLIHTNEHPFFCRYCNYKAKQKFQVIKHLQRHHPDQGELSQGVGKDPSTLTFHLHDVQLERAPSKQPEEAEG